jgi:hypothetical protein
VTRTPDFDNPLQSIETESSAFLVSFPVLSRHLRYYYRYCLAQPSLASPFDSVLTRQNRALGVVLPSS